MRTIKFRGKSFGICEWVYGSLEVFSDDNQQYARIKFDEPYTDEELGITIPVGHDYLVDPETVGQFTGLYDKNGKEIYEGDLLGTKESNHYLEVRYLDGGFRLCGTNDDTGRGSIPIHHLVNNINLVIEVIGNIHDGKEEE